MRLVSYSSNGDGLRAGLLVGEHVIDAVACARHAGLDQSIEWSAARSLLAGAKRDDYATLADAGRALARSVGMPRSRARLGPPIPDPGKILCIGLNYDDHVAEGRRADPVLGTHSDPTVFAVCSSALIGDGDDVVLPAAAPDMIDWEGELAVVIGRRCRRVSEHEALDYVAGYMPFNDVSARDLQTATTQWTMGKAFDTSAPCGPSLVTHDEVGDPQALELTTRVNGEVMQSTNTSLMIHPVRKLVAFISSVITLEPGDIIATGTPAGVGAARDPKVFLKPGDTMTVSITKLGELTNRVVAEDGNR
jgi:2-keto-4-pentenoate hydratase/2-oxohepta-3-ene-1,7-dioic acid hydratase in catechol pathway